MAHRGPCQQYEKAAGQLIGLCLKTSSWEKHAKIAQQYLLAAEACKEDEAHKRYLTGSAERWMRLAEQKKIHGSSSDQDVGGSSEKPLAALKDPVSQRELADDEHGILQRRSMLFGNWYPLDSTVKGYTEIVQRTPWACASHIPVGPRLQGYLRGWVSVPELLDERDGPRPGIERSDDGRLGIHGRCKGSAMVETDLSQGLLHNCTVVAALQAIYNCQKELLSRMWIARVDNEETVRKINIFKMYFNGAFRSVAVNDYLPASNSDEAIYMTDLHDPANLVPAILEKACMQVRGGYDSQGGRCPQDILMLTGWVPDVIRFRGGIDQFRAQMDTIVQSFTEGRVLVTVGTESLTEEEAMESGLIPHHAYTVVKMERLDEHMRFLLKNTWPTAEIEPAQPIQESKAVTVEDRLRSRVSDHSQGKASNGLWFDAEQLVAQCHSISLNWWPGLFRSRQDIHFTWKRQQFLDCAKGRNLVDHPQFMVRTSRGAVLWLLLMRHYMGSSASIRPFNEMNQNAERAVRAAPFISIYAFDGGGRRQITANDFAARTPFTDERHILLKLDPVLEDVLTIATMCDTDHPDRLHPEQTFTLSAFASAEISLDRALPTHAHRLRKTASWTAGTAGGSPSSPTWPTNPQFALHLTKHTSATLVLTASDHQLLVHLHLLFGRSGTRFYELTEREITASSGEYRKASAILQAPSLNPGQHTLVCSTLEPGQLADLTITMLHDDPGAALTLLPGEDAGKFRADASVVFHEGVCRIIIPLNVSRAGSLRIIEQVEKASDGVKKSRRRSPLRIAIHCTEQLGSQGMQLLGMNDFKESTWGVRTEEFRILPRAATSIIVERAPGAISRAPRVEERVNLKILSDVSVSLGEAGPMV